MKTSRRTVALLTILTISGALYTQHALALQDSRRTVQRKVAGLAASDAGLSPGEIRQALKYLEQDRAKHERALRASEREALDDLIEHAEDWSYFQSQPFTCKPMDETDRRHLTRAGLAHDQSLLTSPERAAHLRMVAQFQEHKQTIQAGYTPDASAGELLALQQIADDPVPAPAPNFYNPKVSAVKVHEHLVPAARALNRDLQNRRWF